MSSKNKATRRSTKIHKKASEAIGRAEEHFYETMRRTPQDYDRIFFWSYCYSDIEFKNIMINSLLQAGIPQHLIHIYNKTGFLVNKEGYRRLTKSEREEIRNASLEYESLEEETGASEVYKIADYSDTFSPIENDPLVQALYIFGNFIERNINSGEYNLDEKKFISSYLLIRAFRIVRAIFRSQKFTTGEETLVLVRSLYEIYCKLLYATKNKKNAKYLIDSDFGLAFGNYEILKKDGKLNPHKLVNKRFKKIIPRHRSFYEYVGSSSVKEDTELFTPLYEYLSSFVHSGSRHIFKSWTNSRAGFSLTNDNDENIKVFSIVLTCFISALIMQTLLKLRNISYVSKWDISLFCVSTREVIGEMASPDKSEISEWFSKLQARAAILPKKVPRFGGDREK